MQRLEVPDRVAAQIKDISPLDLAELARQAELAATGTDDFRAVAPAVQSFAAGGGGEPSEPLGRPTSLVIAAHAIDVVAGDRAHRSTPSPAIAAHRPTP